MPGNVNNLPAWDLGNNAYLVDDLEVNYVELQSMAMCMQVLESGGDENVDFSSYTFSRDGLWLEIAGVTNEQAYLNLHNAANQVYEIWCRTDLAATNWDIEQEVWPVLGQEPTPFTVPVLSRTNLFIWARDWTGVDENSNGIPDWWEWKYFGNFNQPTNGDYDSDGTNILDEYQRGADPNKIRFSLQFPNGHVNTNTVYGTITILSGVPSSMAMLVNSTNFAAATWQPYTSSNIPVNLNAGDGNYSVFVGLRGVPSDAQQTWLGTQLTLDTAPPVLTLIWPQDGTAISGDYFTLLAQVDDNTITVTAQIVDANGNTNTIQGLAERNGRVWAQNLPLTSRENTLTVVAIDAAGNISVTNLTVFRSEITVTLNPLSQGQLNQAFVNVSGTVSDPSCAVVVNGKTANVNSDGTWEADNVLVSPAGMATFDVETYAGQQANLAHVTGRALSVNSGAVIHGNDAGANTANGSQLFNQAQPVTVVLSSYTGFRHYQSPTNLLVYLPDNVSWQEDETYNWTSDLGGTWDYAVANNDNGINDLNVSDSKILLSDGDRFIPPILWDYVYLPFCLGWGWPTVGEYPFNPAWEYSSLNTNNLSSNPYHLQRNTRTSVMIVPPVQVPMDLGATNLYLVRAKALEFSDPLNPDILDPATANFDYLTFIGTNYTGDVPLPPEWLEINGAPLMNSGITAADGAVWGFIFLKAPADTTTNVTPVAIRVHQYEDYTFDVQAYEIYPPAVDANRDGNITFDGADQTSADKPYRFWVNDSKEGGDISSAADDIPGSSSPNYNSDHANGRSDLVNFFPVVLCLSNVLQWLPPTNGWEYHLSQADGAVKFIYTALERTNAFDYLTNLDGYDYGTYFNERAITAYAVPVTREGYTLNTTFLDLIQADGNKGVILVEGTKATQKPLMLEIWHKDQYGNNKLMGSVPLYLSIDGVEQMFRHKNFREGADAPDGLVGDRRDTGADTRMSEPQKNPDSLSNGRWFVFVVGSNVGGQNARGWESEVFKRLYWSGNKAKFVGVSWFGDPYTDNNDLIYDYHEAVRNAFATAPSLASFVNGLSGSKTIAGHSLSCGLIASAIADSGMNVNNACLMDAAFAQECFDGDADDNPTAMKPATWQDYPASLWAAHWYEQFPSTDARSTLTWRGRFTGAIGKVYNFYSSTEDCLAEYDGSPTSALIKDAFNWATGGDYTSYVWVLQEKTKGDKIDILGYAHAGSDYGGWGFNTYDGYLTSYPIWYEVIQPCNCNRRAMTPAEIGTVTQDMLDGSRFNPLFNNGWGAFNKANASEIYVNNDTTYFTGPSWIAGLYTTSGGNTIASDPAKHAQLLAEAIPALSLPVGAHFCSQISSAKQFDMPSQFVDATHWPRSVDPTSGTPDWHHSDMDQIAYPYLYKFYNKLVSISNQ